MELPPQSLHTERIQLCSQMEALMDKTYKLISIAELILNYSLIHLNTVSLITYSHFL